MATPDWAALFAANPGRNYLDIVADYTAPVLNNAFANQMAIMGQTPNQTQVQNNPTPAWEQNFPGITTAGAERPMGQGNPNGQSNVTVRNGNIYNSAGQVIGAADSFGMQPPSWYNTPPAWMTQPQQQSPTQNPYLPQITEAMQQQNQFALQNGLNAIRSNSVGVGGLGGSRQGVAEGVATGLAAQGLAGNLANLYGQSWNADQNRSLQRYGIDSNAALGWGGLDNQRYGMDQSFYTAQRGQDLQSMGLGAQLWQAGMNAPWTPIQNANGVYGNYTGFGNSTTTGQQGGGWQGALGGALTGASLGKSFGWWG